MDVQVTTWSLEMSSPGELVPASSPDPEPALVQARFASPEFARFLYTAVGGDWYWVDRLAWTHGRWEEWLTSPGVETWVAYVEGTPAGYFELDGRVEESVELAYFGLLPAFVGRGLGGWLLSRALERAWALRPRRVWVHTCSLDGPHALANYQARGMRVFRVERALHDLRPVPPGPWPEAGSRRPYPRLDRRAGG